MRRAARCAWVGGWMAFMSWAALANTTTLADKVLAVVVFGLWGGAVMAAVAPALVAWPIYLIGLLVRGASAE